MEEIREPCRRRMRVQQRLANGLGVQLQSAVSPPRSILRTGLDPGSPSYKEDVSTQQVHTKPLVDTPSPISRSRSRSRSAVSADPSTWEEEKKETQDTETENEEEGPFAPRTGDHDFASILRQAYLTYVKEKEEHPLEVDEKGRLKGCSDPRTWLGYGFVPDVDKQPTETKTTPRSEHP